MPFMGTLAAVSVRWPVLIGRGLKHRATLTTNTITPDLDSISLYIYLYIQFDVINAMSMESKLTEVFTGVITAGRETNLAE
jgi:hypothetical protein